MSYRDDNRRSPPDVPFVAVGMGMVIQHNCMGCGKRRESRGGTGRGVTWRCAACPPFKKRKVEK